MRDYFPPQLLRSLNIFIQIVKYPSAISYIDMQILN